MTPPLVQLIIVIIVIATVLVITSHYLAPIIPAPWGRLVLALVALLCLLWLLVVAGVLPGYAAWQ